jgi:hypothetical protein
MDTDRAPLDGLKRPGDNRHKFFRFDPTVSSGTLLQIGGLVITVAIGYATYREDRAQTLAKIERLEADAMRDREVQKTSFESFRGDVKDLKTKMDGVSENVAVLKAQSTTPRNSR